MAGATHTSCKARPLVLLLCKALGPGAWPSENSTSTREGDSKETGADIPPGVRAESQQQGPDALLRARLLEDRF